MIDLSMTVKELHHFVRLSKGFRPDLEWWFLEGRNGVSLLSTVARKPPDMMVTSDASGGWVVVPSHPRVSGSSFPWPENWKGGPHDGKRVYSHCNCSNPVGEPLAW